VSGGSYDYLFSWPVERVFSDRTQLRRMAERLEALGPDYDLFAILTRAILHTIDEDLRETDAFLRAMEPLYKAIEWWDSNDWTEDEVREALARLQKGMYDAKAKRRKKQGE
jgi:hypothetical protein